jgi:outer membrane protein OmpA-like peptidoglycan-associated protein
MNLLSKQLWRVTFLVGLASLIAFGSMAQSKRRSLRTANKFFNKENYRAALPHYERVLQSDPDNASVLLKAGISYLSFDKEKASEYIYRAQRLKPKVANDVEYWLGRVDHLNYRFDEAINHFRTYDQSLRRRNDPRKAEIALLSQHARNAKTQFNSPKDVFVKNLGPTINTQYSEHSPVISSDDNYLLFTSRAQGDAGATNRVAADGEYYEDIYESRRLGNDEWEQPRSLGGRLSSSGHDASIQLFDNDTKLLLYRNAGRRDGNGNILVSQKEGGDWSTPVPLGGAINSPNFESDAYITPDGQTIYFSTNNFSENGDLDIYYAKRTNDGDWGRPTKFPVINTQYDEDSPYLTADGRTLFFSSRGHNTMGGYDIFRTDFDSVSRRWSRPVNLGYPVNTPDDDTYYRLSPDGTYAYLSSYRLGGYGEKDIYTINYIRGVNVEGQVISLMDSSVIRGVELVFTGTQADKKVVTYRDITRPDDGRYTVNVLSGRPYQVNIMKDGQTIASDEFEVPVNLEEGASITKNFYIPYIDTTATRMAGQFNKIYFDTDKHDLRPESMVEIENVLRALRSNPRMNIAIDGHTDSRATDQYNMALGDRRARAAYDYLRRNGIPEGRMVINSYGERRPAVPNNSPENMQLNRRTEFQVIPRQDDQEAAGVGTGGGTGAGVQPRR